MIFESTDVQGVMLITPDRFDDNRGFFARTWGQDEFESHGLLARMVQRNLTYNSAAGTLRGMHFQYSPHAETKVVSCLAGAVYDVAIDLRRDSPTRGKWFGAELRPESGRMLYIPEGCAHGYIALEPNTSVEYLISQFYAPSAAGGVRWDDPLFDVRWPMQPSVMADRDATYPDFEASSFL
jgi:dTDP-4-dehydrorhamnose 3,5-epimerase